MNCGTPTGISITGIIYPDPENPFTELSAGIAVSGSQPGPFPWITM
jgi:hypothetical protein